jgi:hypothetical protein
MKQCLFLTALLGGCLLAGCHTGNDIGAAQSVGNARVSASNSIETVVDDMKLCHEAIPHGVPTTFNWQQCPRKGGDPANMRAIIPWGQVYETVAGNPATNTRVQLRDLKVYYLSKKRKRWLYVTGATLVAGAAYREDFAGDASISPDIRTEPDGTVSVKAGGGYNFHFWPSTGRSTISASDIVGVFATCQARLILHDPAQPDDRASAQYILSVGADYWKNLTTGWCADWTCNYDAGIGRFRFVQNDWQAFNMHSLSESAIRSNPPPLE